MTDPQLPERYLLPQGVGAIVTGRVASVLLRRTNLIKLRLQVRGNDPEVDAVLTALHAAAARFRNSSAGIAGPAPEVAVVRPQRPRGEWLSTTEAAEELRCTSTWIRQLIKRGDLTAQRRGSRHLVLADSVDAYPRRESA